MFKLLIALALVVSAVVGLGIYNAYQGEIVFGAAPNVFRPSQGGTGIGSATAGDVGKVLKVSDDSPFTYTLQDDNTGAGGSFPWTPTSWGNSTSTVLGNTLGFFANGSSTFNILRAQHATTSNLNVTGLLTFNGVTGSTWASFCTTITGSADLCDGSDAAGSGGGTTAVATSSSETSGRVPFWTSTAGTPAQLSGGVAGFAWNDTFKRLTATYSSSTVSSATTFYGALVGNADTATALAADPANCSAGNAPLGIVATGAVEGCFDVWTEAENTSAGYVVGTRALTIAGTANQITSSAGSQNLTADRTWTLSLPNHVIFPSSFVASLSSTTHSTTTWLTTHRLASDASDGILFEANNGTDIAILGAGNSANSTFYGGVNIDGSTRLATSLTGLLRADSGVVSVATAGVDYANFAYPFTPATSWVSTSTLFLNTGGFMSNASSSIAFLDSVRSTSTSLVATNATTSALRISSVLSFGGVAGDAWSDFCTSITGGAGLCDGVDATGSTDVMLWSNASSSPLSVLSLNANSSSSIAFLSMTRATSTDFISTNATTTQQYVGTHLYSAGTTRINVNSGLLSTGATGVIQSTTVSSPLGFSANTLTCTTCATFSYPFTPATSWFSTSTIELNTAGFMSNASSTFHILRNTYASSTYASFSTATTSALIVSGLGGNGTRCLQADSSGVVSANASACGTGSGGADYNKWATSTGSMLGINPLTAFFVGIGTSTPRSLLHLATSTAPQLTISDGFASYDSWNFRTVGGTFFLATSSMATNATSSLSVLTIGSDGVVNFGNRINTCIALTGSSDLCDGVDSGGVGGTSAASKWATTTGMLSIYPAGALRIGVGTTSPYGVFSANGNTWPQLMLSDNNLTTNMKHWVASTTPFGKLAWGIMNDAFTSITTALTIGTSTPDYAGNSGSLVVGTTTNGAYYGLGTSSAQFWLNGRIDTGDWHFSECAATGNRTAQVTADQTGSVISTTLGRPCPQWMFNEDNAGVLDETVMNGYSYFRLRAGATGVTNAAAGDGMGIHHTTSWMNFASNTPTLAAAVRFGAIQNATTSLYMIGYGSMTGTAADLAALPTYYVGVVSSTTEGNWIAVIKNGNTWQYKNTGIASSSVLLGETSWGTWDIKVSSTTAIFTYRGTNGIATTTNHLVTGGAAGTEAYIPTHNGLRVTPVVSTGKPTIGLQQELHVRWIRLWWRDLIY